MSESSLPPKHVFVIGVDGAGGRWLRQAHTPNIDAAMADGVVTYAARTELPSASFQAWGSLFHGVAFDKHRLGDKPIDEQSPWPSWMKVALGVNPRPRCAAFSCWRPINSMIIEPSLDCDRISMGDPELVAAAVAFIVTQKPQLFFMQLDYVDHAGHAHGYGSEKYLAQITATDALVGQVLDAIRSAGLWDQSLVMIISDHGGHDHTHGSDHDDCMTIFWSARGPGIARGAELSGSVKIMDTAAVVARFLDLPAPPAWDATVPAGVFA